MFAVFKGLFRSKVGVTYRDVIQIRLALANARKDALRVQRQADTIIRVCDMYENQIADAIKSHQE